MSVWRSLKCMNASYVRIFIDELRKNHLSGKVHETVFSQNSRRKPLMIWKSLEMLARLPTKPLNCAASSVDPWETLSLVTIHVFTSKLKAIVQNVVYSPWISFEYCTTFVSTCRKVHIALHEMSLYFQQALNYIVTEKVFEWYCN